MAHAGQATVNCSVLAVMLNFGRGEAVKLAPDTIIPSPPSGNRTEKVSILVPGKNPEVSLKEVRLPFQFPSGKETTGFPFR